MDTHLLIVVFGLESDAAARAALHPRHHFIVQGTRKFALDLFIKRYTLILAEGPYVRCGTVGFVFAVIRYYHLSLHRSALL